MPIPLLALVIPGVVGAALVYRARKPRAARFLVKPFAKAYIPRPGAKASFDFQRSETHRHRGIDLGAPVGTPIFPSAPGVVVHAISRPGTPGFRGYGRVVVIRHDNGLYTLYSHLHEVKTQEGASVGMGDSIGTVGRSCDTADNPNHLCDGPHLHFELSAKAYPQDAEAPRLDPTKYLLA